MIELTDIVNYKAATPFSDLMYIEEWNQYCVVNKFSIENKNLDNTNQNSSLTGLFNTLSIGKFSVELSLSKQKLMPNEFVFVEKITDHSSPSPLTIKFNNHIFKKCIIQQTSIDDTGTLCLNFVYDTLVHTPYPLDIKDIVDFSKIKSNKKAKTTNTKLSDKEFSELFDKLL